LKETLRLLYLLQKVDNDLDEVEESKGDLPETVQRLEEEIIRLSNATEERQRYIDEQIAARNQADEDIESFGEKLKKYKAQQYQVRNNKEYDAITKEIDFAEESIKKLTRQFEDFENSMSVAKGELNELTTKLEEFQKELKEKTAELQEITKETEEEELEFKHKREKLVVKMKKELLSRYNNIRSARGKAVVPIRKDSCSGCGNRIPPQHIIEIRRNDNMYFCQHCGRIVISEELAKNSSE